MAFFNAVDGVIAFADPGHFYIDEDGLLVVQNYNAYGLVLLVIAAVEVFVGCAILMRERAGQWFGILIAVISALIHLAYWKHYPAWSSIALVLDLIVIYALIVHGEE